MISSPMFEYTALVDAPVRRFTGIVTGSDADDEPVVVAAVAPRRRPSVRTPESSVLVAVGAAPDNGTPEPLTATEAGSTRIEAAPTRVAPAPDLGVAQVVRAATAPRPIRRPRASAPPEPTQTPALVPALIAIAAAGVTAMWWLRRDSHDR